MTTRTSQRGERRVRRQPRAVGTSPLLTLGLWLVIVLAQLAPLGVLGTLPWATALAWWVLPASLGAGIALGVVLALVVPMHPWWRTLALVPLLAVGAAVGAALAVRGATGGAQIALGAVLLGAYATALDAALPWLVVRARQPWLAAALLWALVVGAWSGLGGDDVLTGLAGDALPLARRTLWLAWLLALSLLLVGLARQRAEQLRWREDGLQRIGPVGRAALRPILYLSLAVALLGLIPTDAVQWQALAQLYRRSPLAQHGPLALTGAGGVPVSAPGAPLALDAPSTQDTRILLTYQVLVGTPQQTPLLAATYDTFDGTVWTQGATSGVVPVQERLPFPPDAELLKARVTVEATPDDATPALLLGFSQPVEFSLPAAARLVGGSAATPLTVAGWQSLTPVGRGTSYTTASAVLAADARPHGSLPPDLTARMTSVPAALDATLAATAKSWAGNARTPQEQSQALLNALRQHATLDRNASAAPGADGVAQFLQTGHGNALVWTTTYVLLCRSLGLPMRLAEGYLPGTFDSGRARFVIRASDAAVWAQLAIPGEGWVDLFPAADLTIVQVLTPKKGALPPPVATQQTHPQQGATVPGLGAPATGSALLIIVLSVLALALLVVVLGLSLRWARLGRALSPVARVFARVALLARLAGIELQPSDTARSGGAKVADYLPEAQATLLASLTATYERISYGPPPARGDTGSVGEGGWRRLSGALWRLVLTRPWRRTPPPTSTTINTSTIPTTSLALPVAGEPASQRKGSDA